MPRRIYTPMYVYLILAVKILAFREQSAKSAKILTTKISRYTVIQVEICTSCSVLIQANSSTMYKLLSDHERLCRPIKQAKQHFYG